MNYSFQINQETGGDARPRRIVFLDTEGPLTMVEWVQLKGFVELIKPATLGHPATQDEVAKMEAGSKRFADTERIAQLKKELNTANIKLNLDRIKNIGRDSLHVTAEDIEKFKQMDEAEVRAREAPLPPTHEEIENARKGIGPVIMAKEVPYTTE